MDVPPLTRLEWMRNEFQAARRRHLVKAAGSVPPPETDTLPASATPTLVIDTVATHECTEAAPATLPFDAQGGPGTTRLS